MPFLRVRSNIADKFQVRLAVFSALVDKIPENKNWFGVVVRLINPFNKKAKSSSSALFLAFASVIGDFVHSIIEFKESIFITPDKVTDRWVEHIKNTYLDYYGEEELAKIPWERQRLVETKEQYEARLIEISNKLKNLFSPKSITLDELKKSIEAFFTSINATATVVAEPWVQVKPYPSAALYRPSKFFNETDENFEKRLSIYKKYYEVNDVNTVYPPVFSAKESLKVFGYNPLDSVDQTKDYVETEEVKKQRVDLLKNDLGSYTYLGESNKTYLSSKHFGSYIDVTVLCDSSFVGLSGIEAYLKDVKPAGVVINYTINSFCGASEKPVYSAESYYQELSAGNYMPSSTVVFYARLYSLS